MHVVIVAVVGMHVRKSRGSSNVVCADGRRGGRRRRGREGHRRGGGISAKEVKYCSAPKKKTVSKIECKNKRHCLLPSSTLLSSLPFVHIHTYFVGEMGEGPWNDGLFFNGRSNSGSSEEETSLALPLTKPFTMVVLLILLLLLLLLLLVLSPAKGLGELPGVVSGVDWF